ncbi:MAG TPA: hypothetical protein VF981_03475 [Gemmatimonadaceae bacterium]
MRFDKCRRPPTRRPASVLVCGLLAVVLARVAGAQVVPPARTTFEVRAEVTAGPTTVAQIGGGVQFTTGTYFRSAMIAAAGLAWNEGRQGGSARVEGQARFHLDPWRQAGAGAYGIGGIAATWDAFAQWQPRLVVGIGLELPAHGGTGWAIEAALGGGFRMTAVLRAANPDRR